MSSDLLTQITDLVTSEDPELAEAVTSMVTSARQLVSGSDFTISLAPVAAIGSFLVIVGLTPFAGFLPLTRALGSHVGLKSFCQYFILTE